MGKRVTAHREKGRIPFFEHDEDARVRVHGNGFVQAELANGDKLHIWHPDCPQQSNYTGIHNHNHSFASTVIIGTLLNVEYQPIAHGDHYHAHQAQVRQDKDTILVGQQHFYDLKIKRHMIVKMGSSYVLPADENLYHETTPLDEFVVTHIRRLDEVHSFEPTVMVRAGSKPDNDFDRYGHEATALEIYRYAKQRIKHFLTTNVELYYS